MAVQALILGCAGTTLSGEERALFKEVEPWGLILFKRNVADHAQLKRLIGEFRETVGRNDAPVLIDQEGGRVQRLGPPLCADRRPLVASGSDKAWRAPHRA
jgi:beta-N-acetylhexosaminidase